MNNTNLINTLLRDFQFRLKKYVASRIDNPFEVEEIVQETLIAAVDSYPGFRHQSSFFTWLCGIANHEIIDYRRKKKIKTILFSLFPFLEDLAEQALGPEQQLLKTELEQEMEKRVRNTLKQLDEGYAQVLRLRYYQRFSVGQIAKKLNESYKTIESRLTRARKAFAQVYLADHSQRNLPVSFK